MSILPTAASLEGFQVTMSGVPAGRPREVLLLVGEHRVRVGVTMIFTFPAGRDSLTSRRWFLRSTLDFSTWIFSAERECLGAGRVGGRSGERGGESDDQRHGTGGRGPRGKFTTVLPAVSWSRW